MSDGSAVRAAACRCTGRVRAIEMAGHMLALTAMVLYANAISRTAHRQQTRLAD